ncbi:MAG: Rpn family recombination-promoting nuclease/putative transposase [Clostridium sp.]|nr:Rpn family recombination-promoting nuclease/putative transposase [Clostridium sp.]MCM1444274.1 Rpn family recombination-promoting nuclease/putative transposase [Candidatus Amulumruptor caecigallinarius]
MKKNTKYIDKGKVLKLSRDIVFKNIMKDNKNKKFLALFISTFTKLDYNYALDNLVIKDTDTLESNKHEHHNTGDLVADIINNRINIEVSIGNRKINKRKNEVMAFKYTSNQYKIGDRYENGYKFIQICIEDYKVFNNNLVINEGSLIETSSGRYEKETDEFKIIHICLKNIPEKCYTMSEQELTKEEKILMMFTVDDIKKLERIVKGDEIMEEAFESLKNISQDESLISEYEKNQMFDYCYKKALHEEKQNGITEGSSNKAIEIARNMLNKGFDIKIISEITELSVEKIEKLIQP